MIDASSAESAKNSAVPPASTTHPVLLFDGVCNLCHASVIFVLRHERGPELRFCALQSRAGRSLLSSAGKRTDALESVVLIEQGVVFERSDAALAIARHLRAPWRWIRVFRIVPRRWRDALYNVVALRRYRWFGKQEQVCLVPTPELRARILD